MLSLMAAGRVGDCVVAAHPRHEPQRSGGDGHQLGCCHQQGGMIMISCCRFVACGQFILLSWVAAAGRRCESAVGWCATRPRFRRCFLNKECAACCAGHPGKLVREYYPAPGTDGPANGSYACKPSLPSLLDAFRRQDLTQRSCGQGRCRATARPRSSAGQSIPAAMRSSTAGCAWRRSRRTRWRWRRAMAMPRSTSRWTRRAAPSSTYAPLLVPS